MTSYSQPDAISLESTNNTITLKTNSLSRLTIKNDGMIGIGTTSPVTPLTIHDAGQIGGNYKSHLLIMDKTAYNQPLNGGSILFGGLKNSTETGYWSKISGEKANTTVDNTAGVLKFWTRSGSTAPQQRMIIDDGGDVGINITNPTSKLDVGGDINTTGSYKINGTALATEDLTNNSGFITASASNTLTNKLVIKHDTNAPNPNSDDVGLLVTNVTDNTEDAVITIRGSRNGSLTAKTSQLRFENLDNNPAPTMIKTLGAICSVVTDFTSNIGSLKFYTFSDGFTESVCMEMKSNNDIAITSSATIGSNLTVTGTVTTGGLTFTNDDGGTTTISNMLESINSISSTLNGYGDAVDYDVTTSVTSSSGNLITSGGVFTTLANVSISPTRQLVGYFEYTTNTDFNGDNPYVCWDTTIVNNNGITHYNGSTIPNNSLFNVIESGLYVFSIFLPLQNTTAGGRSMVSADIQVYTGSSFTTRGSLYVTHPIGNTYMRGNDSDTNTAEICGTVTIFLQAGKQFEIKGRNIYQTNRFAHVECRAGTTCMIERISSSINY